MFAAPDHAVIKPHYHELCSDNFARNSESLPPERGCVEDQPQQTGNFRPATRCG
jgi:hypothetical protein